MKEYEEIWRKYEEIRGKYIKKNKKLCGNDERTMRKFKGIREYCAPLYMGFGT